jgi:hypothetical protein
MMRARLAAGLLGAATQRGSLCRPASRQLHSSPLIKQQLGCFAAVDSSWDWLKDPENPRLQRFLKVRIATQFSALTQFSL